MYKVSDLRMPILPEEEVQSLREKMVVAKCQDFDVQLLSLTMNLNYYLFSLSPSVGNNCPIIINVATNCQY